MATEAFDDGQTATAKKGRQPLTFNGNNIAPRDWKKLDLHGELADWYAAYKAGELKIKQRLAKGLAAKHVKSPKHGVMISLKGDKPSYVICDKAAARETEAFSD